MALPSKNMLEFNFTSEKLILFSPKAFQVKAMIDYFITELKKVRGLRGWKPGQGGQWQGRSNTVGKSTPQLDVAG